MKIDLTDNKYEVCPFYFKADKETLDKLKKFGDIVEENIIEVSVPVETLIKLINDYPSAKVIGFVEEWTLSRKVLVVYSDSGSTEINKSQFAGYFDGHDDDRWSWSWKPYKDFDTKFLVLNCGEYENVNYKCPFKDDWDK